MRRGVLKEKFEDFACWFICKDFKRLFWYSCDWDARRDVKTVCFSTYKIIRFIL